MARRRSSEMRNRWWAKLLLLLTSLVVCLLVAEGIYRIYVFGTDFLSVAKVNSFRNLGTSGLVQRSSHKEVIYELKPNLDTLHKLAPLKTNSRGLHDQEYALPKPPNTFRIAFVGDSLTQPVGVALEEAFHSLLETRLNQEFASAKVEYQAINFGTGGYNLRQYLGVLTHKARQYDLDLVVVGFCPINDHSDILPDRFYEEPYQVKDKTYPFFGSFVLKRAYYWTRSIVRADRESNGASQASDRRGVLADGQKEHMSEIFAKIREFGDEEKIPIVVTYLNTTFKPRATIDAEIVEELVTEQGLQFVDLSRGFIGKEPTQYWISPIDYHPNAAAQQIFADQLYDFLRQQDLLTPDANLAVNHDDV